MSTAAAPPMGHLTTTPRPLAPAIVVPSAPDLYRLTVEQYHRIVEAGALTPDDPVEFLDGYLVAKMSKNPPHAAACRRARQVLERWLPSGWFVAIQDPITLDVSEPEPDLNVIRGTNEDFETRHPGPSDVGLVVEVSDTTLTRDREWKRRIYARNGIPAYWIVNLVDHVLEVYTQPSGPGTSPDYGNVRTLRPGESVELALAGAVAGTVPVAELFT